jgi:hypothetical protein
MNTRDYFYENDRLSPVQYREQREGESKEKREIFQIGWLRSFPFYR